MDKTRLKQKKKKESYYIFNHGKKKYIKLFIIKWHIQITKYIKLFVYKYNLVEYDKKKIRYGNHQVLI